MTSKTEQASVNLNKFDEDAMDSLLNKYSSKKHAKVRKHDMPRETRSALSNLSGGTCDETKEKPDVVEKPFITKQSLYNRTIKKLSSFARAPNNL